MGVRCVECTGGYDHCHGALVVHDDELVECTDSTCVDPDSRRHTLRVGCGDAFGTCRCDRATGERVYPVAS